MLFELNDLSVATASPERAVWLVVARGPSYGQSCLNATHRAEN